MSSLHSLLWSPSGDTRGPLIVCEAVEGLKCSAQDHLIVLIYGSLSLLLVFSLSPLSLALSLPLSLYLSLSLSLFSLSLSLSLYLSPSPLSLSLSLSFSLSLKGPIMLALLSLYVMLDIYISLFICTTASLLCASFDECPRKVSASPNTYLHSSK